MRTNDFKFKAILKAAVMGTVLLFGVVAAFGQQIINLTAQPTIITLPDGSTVPMWGYFCGTPVIPSTATCAALNPMSAATASTPASWSPVIITVPTGQSLQINLTNNLLFQPPTPAGGIAPPPNAIPTSIMIVGQVGGGLGSVTQRTTDPNSAWDHSQAQAVVTWPIANTGASGMPPVQGPRVRSFGTEVAAVAVGSTTAPTALTWSALRPGTYLLESGTHPSIQVPMGLYGILVVTSAPTTTGAGIAYPAVVATRTTPAIPAVQYNAEVPLEFSEIDPAQNKAVSAAVNTAGFVETAAFRPFGPFSVANVSVVTPGSGYTAPPNVSISGAGGSGAMAVATIDTTPGSPTFSQVTGITVTNGGTGYVSDPSVTITSSNGAGSGATATAYLSGPTSGTYCAGAALACYPPAVNYTPLYFLINGVAFNKNMVGPSVIQASTGTATGTVGGTVLVRLVNAGLRMHVPSIVGSQTAGFNGAGAPATVNGFSLIAEDGNPVPWGVPAPRVQTDVFMAAGKTFDVMINAPAAGASALPVYDRELSLSGNSSERDAGMLAYISVNNAVLPVPAVMAAVARPDVYSAVIPCAAAPCRPFTVSDVAKGVIVNDTNVYGVQVSTLPTGGTVTLAANGTFTYVPKVGTTSDSFGYCANGTTLTSPAPVCTTVTLNACTPGTTATNGCLEGASGITMGNASYTAKTSTYINIPPPGVLAYDKDGAGYPLTVAVSSVAATGVSVHIQPNGGFIATTTGPGVYQFSYKAQNSQGTLSSTAATVTLTFPVGNGPKVTVLDGHDKTTVVRDYRWIIEEDRTFYINPDCTTNSTVQPQGCPPVVSGGTVPTFGVNFHTSAMPVVAQGCTGQLSCESGQTVFNPATNSHVAAACDAGNGVCDTTRPQETPVDPSSVLLDPTKRYYISVLPGDAANPFNTANVVGGHGMGGAPIIAPCLPLGTCTSTSTFSPVTVLSQPNPYPPGRLSGIVFEDDFPLNGEQDPGGGAAVLPPNEPGLGGFEIILWDAAGLSGDFTGQMTHDMFNMPLSNALAGQIDPATGFDACPISTQVTSNAITSGPNQGSQKGITGRIVTCPKYESDGSTLSPLAGQFLVANLMPGRFSVQAIPGADRIARGEEWLQTNTLDGQHPHDSFIRIGEPSYFQEFGPAGYHVSIGFANPAIINARHNAVCQGAYGGVGACNNTVMGQIVGNRMSRTPDERLYPSGSRDALYWTQCWVSLGDPDAEDFMFTKCDANGNFKFTNVPGGEWRLTIGDQWNDQIIDGLSTAANIGVSATGTTEPKCPGPLSTPGSGGTCDMGQIAVHQWQANVYTKTFIDDDRSGVYKPTDLGIPLLNTTARYRDGSLANNLLTDFTGTANFNETFPLFNWYVVETDTTRYKTTGIHTVYDAGGPADGTMYCGPANGNAPCGTSTAYNFLANTNERVPLPPNLSVPGAVYCTSADCGGQSIAKGAVPSFATASTGRIDPPWVVAEGWQGFTGQSNFIEFGKTPYAAATPTAPAENGGIRGHVVYAATRPFDDPRMLVQDQWEPLVPHVTMNLYKEDFAIDPATGKPGSTPTLTLVDTTQTSSWDDWAQGFRSDGIPNMNCPGQLPGPNVVGPSAPYDLFFFTLYNQPSYLDLYNKQHSAFGVDNLNATGTPLPFNSQYKCYDGMHNWNQLQPAPYDGMYSFPSVLGYNPNGPNAGKLNTTLKGGVGVPGTSNFVAANMGGTNCTICIPNPDTNDPWRVGTPMLPPGKYVVEVVPPPGYELVKEEDKNILIGDNFIAPVTQEFAGFSSYVFIIPDQASVASAYDQSGSGSNPNNAQDPTQYLGANPHTGPIPGFLEPLWPCVGQVRIVPDYMSIFPLSKEVAPFAGATRQLCDRKEVTLGNQMAVTAKFYIYTSTHISAHYTGVITDDFTSEFDPFAPAFGEKFAPPNLPVSIRDWTGAETSRVYSDHFGLFDGITYSSWEVNPPNPTGFSPTMMVTCMNDKGPILDTNPRSPTYNQMIRDPLYNPVYSQFCYELAFMPGETDYMDTPVVPTAAFAGGYNFPDCEYPDATPAIKEVDGDGMGPWVSAAGHTLTITALGNVNVPDAGYSGPPAKVAPFNAKTVNRHFGFGTRCTSPSAGSATCNTQSRVTIGGFPAPIESWSDSSITVTVPHDVPACAVQQQAQYGGPNGTTVSTALCGELVITAGNGKQSVDTVTVTVGGKAPTRLSAPPNGTIPVPGVIQSAIDQAAPGDLLIVGPGTYTEMVIMWKPVRLQGVGAASVVINANTHPAGLLLDSWRRHVNCLFGLTLDGVPVDATHPYDSPTDTANNGGPFTCPDTGWTEFKGAPNSPQVDRVPLEAVVGWNVGLNGNLAELLQEPTLMGAYEGAGITVLARGLDFHNQDPFDDGAYPVGTTLLQDTPGVLPPAAGAVNASHCTDVPNPYPSNFMCNPSSIDGLSSTNSSQGGGGIFVHGWAHNLQIANNRIYNNTGTLSGGISVGQGEFAPAYLQGSIANADPGSCRASAVTNQQLPYCLDLNVNVHNNSVTQNSSIGDELFAATLAGGGGVTFCTGSDYYKFNYNWVCGNLSSGEGGGVTHLGYIWNGDIEHNSILFNQSSNPTIPTNGGGLMVQGTPDTDPVCGTQPDLDCPPGLSDGTGPGLVINANLIQGNSADSGSGGGMRLQSVNGTEVSALPSRPDLWYSVNVTNNIIVNNVAGWDGAGVSLQDALVVNLVNNTIAHNDSTATSGVLNNTLGAALASAPGGNCVAAGGTTSCPQPAGLVSVPNTSLLTTTFTGLTITCPAGHDNCKGFSNPILYNNLFWQNRAFDIGVGGLGTATLNQQNTVTLYEAFTTTPAPTQTSTGACPAFPATSYWDIGVRGDTGPGDHSSGFTLAPTWSVLSTPGSYPGLQNNYSNPTFVSQYCNGSRIPPECTPAMGCVSGAGWAVPPGISDAVVPNPVFSLTPAATVDEGNNWINLTWGPLSLTSPSIQGPDGNWGGGPPLGNYVLQTTSPAVDYVPIGQPHPSTDFFGNPRPDPPIKTCFDVGAVELRGVSLNPAGCAVTVPTLYSISPNVGLRGTAVNVTLTGINLAGATAVTVNPTFGISVSNVVASATGTSVTATFTITNAATLSARNVTVTTPGGVTNSVTFTVVPPTVTSITPTSALRGSTNLPVTITGIGLTGATVVGVGDAGVTVGPITVTNGGTTLTTTFTISNTAALSTRVVRVTTPAGITPIKPSVTFTVLGPTVTSIATTPPTTPPSGVRGTTVQVAITGTGLMGATVVGADGGITSSNITVTNGGTTLTATLTIASNASASTRVVTVTTPIGVTPINPSVTFAVRGATVTFSNPALTSFPANRTTKNGTITVTNTATGATAGRFTLTAAPTIAQTAGTGVFTITGGTCTLGFTVNPGGTCTINVRYVPPATGNASSTAHVVLMNSGAAANPLSGPSFNGD